VTTSAGRLWRSTSCAPPSSSSRPSRPLGISLGRRSTRTMRSCPRRDRGMWIWLVRRAARTCRRSEEVALDICWGRDREARWHLSGADSAIRRGVRHRSEPRTLRRRRGLRRGGARSERPGGQRLVSWNEVVQVGWDGGLHGRSTPGSTSMMASPSGRDVQKSTADPTGTDAPAAGN
jgi:hypothetical protein